MNLFESELNFHLDIDKLNLLIRLTEEIYCIGRVVGCYLFEMQVTVHLVLMSSRKYQESIAHVELFASHSVSTCSRLGR